MAAAAGAALLALGTAVPTNAETLIPAENSNEVCEVVEDVVWKATSTIVPGEMVKHQPKEVTLGGDVAIDGWWQSPSAIDGKGDEGVDTWEEAGTPYFRVIVGTVEPLHSAGAEVTIESADVEFAEPGAPRSPALAATPERYQKIVLEDLAQPVKTSGSRIEWGGSPRAVRCRRCPMRTRSGHRARPRSSPLPVTSSTLQRWTSAGARRSRSP